MAEASLSPGGGRWWMMITGGWSVVDDDHWWMITSGWWSLVDDDHWWMMITGGWWSLMDGDHWWMVITGGWPLVDDHWWVITGGWSLVGDRWWMISGGWSLVDDHWWVITGGWWRTAECLGWLNCLPRGQISFWSLFYSAWCIRVSLDTERSWPQFSVGSLFLCVLLSPDIAIRGKHLPGVGVNGQCLEVMLADVLEHS